jgi:K+-sensing histidine kinase KdpD
MSIRPMWNRGRRNRVYWDLLHSNPILDDQIGRAIWSLGQAQLIIDNGRFLLGDLTRLNRKPYQMRSVVEDCLQILNSQRLSRNILVKAINRGAAPGVMNADEPILKVAIMNLVDNAFKYSQVGGPVVWGIEYGVDSFKFYITSSGSYIDDEQFQTFLGIGVRGHQQDHLNQRHGTGLGLPVANKILVAHSPRSHLKLVSKKPTPNSNIASNTFFFEMPYLTGQSHRSEE